MAFDERPGMMFSFRDFATMIYGYLHKEGTAGPPGLAAAAVP
jgi:hypothetical protein